MNTRASRPTETSAAEALVTEFEAALNVLSAENECGWNEGNCRPALTVRFDSARTALIAALATVAGEPQAETSEPMSFTIIGLKALAEHVRACPDYKNLRGDMDHVDRALAALGAGIAAAPIVATQGDRETFDRYYIARQRSKGFGGMLTDAEMIAHHERQDEQFHAWLAGRALRSWPDADDPIFREVFEEACKGSNLPLKRKGDLYESTYVRTAFLVAYSVVNRIGKRLDALTQPAQAGKPQDRAEGS